MTVLLIAGSPSNPSRSSVLLDAVEQRLRLRGVDVERLHIRDLPPQALVLADFSHPSVTGAAAHILPGIYATDAQVVLLPEGGYQVHADIAARAFCPRAFLAGAM